MIWRVDWISFSVVVNPAQDGNDRSAAYRAAEALQALHPDLVQWLRMGDDFTPERGRAPYNTSWVRDTPGLRIFTHPDLPHALFEVSGQGCDRLTLDGFMDGVLSAVAPRCTRVDVACDILTETRPIAFDKERSNGRFKSRSEIVSEDGETVYVGSRSSDRYARVYRYNPPHERSHFLRVEHVIKAENAQIMARAIPQKGLASVVASLGQAFGWEHADWSVNEDPAEIAVYRPERREGKTLYWLADTIAPLLVRLHNEGVLDIADWLDTHVLPKLKD